MGPWTEFYFKVKVIVGVTAIALLILASVLYALHELWMHCKEVRRRMKRAKEVQAMVEREQADRERKP